MVSQDPWLQMTDALFTMLAGNNIVTSTGSPVKCTLPVSTDSELSFMGGFASKYFPVELDMM